MFLMFIKTHMPTAAAAIVAMMVACLLPSVLAACAKATGGFRFAVDNQAPRDFCYQRPMSARLYAAHQNSYESLPIFLAAVIVAMYFFVPQPVVNMLAWLYIVSRVCYALCYAFNWHVLRSVMWLFGILSCMMLFCYAALVAM